MNAAVTTRYDAVGKCSFRQCRSLLKSQGIWTSTDLGPLSQSPLLVLATHFSRGRRVLFPFPRIDQETVEYLKGFVESGQFTPVVDRTYPLEEIVDAYRYLETQQKIQRRDHRRRGRRSTTVNTRARMIGAVAITWSTADGNSDARRS